MTVPDEHLRSLVGFVRERLAAEEIKEQVDVDSPLFEWGVLDSLKTAMLVNFVRREMGVTVPPAALVPDNFSSVRRIGAMIARLRDASSGGTSG